MGGSQKSTTTQVNKIPEWMETAAKDLFYESKESTTPFEAYDPTGTVDKYMNPYVSNVLTDSVNELIRANKIGKQDIAAKAIGAGAFGGSRHGIAESEADRALYEKVGQLSNQILAQSYDKASDTARSEHLRGQDYDLNQASQLAGILAGSPHTSTSTATEKTSGGGIGQILGGGLALASQLPWSDERMKENRTPADGEEILGAFEKMPVDDYEYKEEFREKLALPEARTGPMAQDVKRLLGPESSDGSRIDMADMLGKVIAALKTLDERTAGMKAQAA